MDAITLALAKQYANKKVNNIVYDSKETLTISGEDQVSAPFTELVGLEVVEKMPGRRLLAASVERFAEEPETTLYRGLITSDGSTAIQYGTFDGMLDKPCLTIDSAAMATHCPSYFFDKSSVMLCYAFEETHDTMGLGVTMTSGWYTADGGTFAVEPFDPEQHPFFMTTEMLNTYAEDGAADYLHRLFPLAEEFAYTVSESNIFEHAGITAACPMKVNHIVLGGTDSALYAIGGLHYHGSFSIHDGDVWVGINPSINNKGEKTVSITYPVIKQLNPKFIPSTTPTIQKAEVGQSIIVKAVDDNGKPTEWETEDVCNKAVSSSKEYTDSQRLGYTEKKPTLVLEETTIDCQVDEDLGGLITCIIAPLDVTVGDAVTVTWDGVVYNTVYQTHTLDDAYTNLFGNPAYVGVGDNNGIPFMYTMIKGEDGEDIGFILAAEPGEHLMSVVVAKTIVHTIPDEYIMPFFDTVWVHTPLSINRGGGITQTYLSEADSELLQEAVDKGRPVVIRMSLNGSEFCGVFSCHGRRFLTHSTYLFVPSVADENQEILEHVQIVFYRPALVDVPFYCEIRRG